MVSLTKQYYFRHACVEFLLQTGPILGLHSSFAHSRPARPEQFCVLFGLREWHCIRRNQRLELALSRSLAVAEVETPAIGAVILWISKSVVCSKRKESGAKFALKWIVISHRC